MSGSQFAGPGWERQRAAAIRSLRCHFTTHPSPPSPPRHHFPPVLNGADCSQDGAAKISSSIVLEGRVTSDAFRAATLKHLKGCSYELSPLEISLWQLQSADELLGSSSPHLMFVLSLCRLSDCHLHTLSIFSSILSSSFLTSWRLLTFSPSLFGSPPSLSHFPFNTCHLLPVRPSTERSSKVAGDCSTALLLVLVCSGCRGRNLN